MLRTFLTDDSNLGVTSESFADWIPELKEMYPGKDVTVNVEVNNASAAFEEGRAGNIKLVTPVSVEFLVSLGSNSSMTVLEFTTNIETLFDASFYGGMAYIAILDSTAGDLHIESDNIRLSDRISDFVADLNSRLSFMFSDLDKQYFE